MSTTTPVVDGRREDGPPELERRDSGFVESVLDNLSAWTVIASAIGLLYLVWVTLEILSRYVGDMPRVGP